MENKVYEIIKPWAGIETWHSGHPMDEQRFYKAMHKLVSELGVSGDLVDDFNHALKKYIPADTKDQVTNDFWNNLLERYSLKAEIILSYEFEK
jgi:hypothetical protein